MLGVRNSSQKEEFYTRGRHEKLEVHYMSQSYFGLPRKNCDSLILFKQTLRDVQSLFCNIRAYGMLYSEFKEMCHKAWSERFNYLYIDIAKNKNKGKFPIFNEIKHTYIECIPESEPF